MAEIEGLRGKKTSPFWFVCDGRGWHGRVRRSDAADGADTVDWDELVTSVGCTPMNKGRSVVVMANGEFFETSKLEDFGKEGESLE